MSNLAYAHYTKGQHSESMQLLVRGITTERPKLNAYLVSKMVGTLSAAYDEEEYREKLQLTDENGNKLLSVGLRMARLLSDLRLYGKANDFLQTVIERYPDHELAKELNEKMLTQMEKNNKQRELMNIKNHPPYNTNTTYKIAIDLSNFIQKYYSPLNFSVPWLLDRAEKASQPDDPFVLWYKIKWYMEIGEKEKIVQGLDQAIKLQQDFMPLLKLIGEYYEVIGEQEQAVEIFSRILELYPGEPDSLKYQQKILTYTENKMML